MRARKSRSEWAAIVKAFERSGESHEEFCSKRSLKIGTFRSALYRWRKAEDVAPELALVPVEVVDRGGVGTARSAEPSELAVVVAGVEVRVVVGTDIGYVGALVAELRSRC
jgi:hypothetical protein